MKKLFLLSVVLSLSFFSHAQILFNQLGYYPHASKTAAVIDRFDTLTYFRIIDERNIVRLERETDSLRQSKHSSLKVRLIDFSDITASGTYRIQAGTKRGNLFFTQFTSSPFVIGDSVLHDASKAVLKSFYYQRASMDLLPQYAGIWSRPMGHPDTIVYIHPSAATAQRPTGTVISSPGGWYDAGDYNKYIVNCGITMGTLLSAYEDFPDYWQTIDLNILESGNDIPDILDEIAYNLRWMLTMQDIDGGVYHKVTIERLLGSFDFTMPREDTKKRWAVKKNTAATLDFAAVTAQAYRIYKNFPQTNALADSCLIAAERAWNWALLNPHIFYSKREEQNDFSPPIFTGPYDDDVERRDENGNWVYDWSKLDDEWYWAACELYLSTGISQYKDTIESRLRPYELFAPMHRHVKMLGHYSLLRLREEEFPVIRREIIGYAGYLESCISSNAYGTVMGAGLGVFIWGGNLLAANQSITLLNAYKLTQEEHFLNAALTNIDYLLGRNPTGYSFVTGYGSKSPMHPFHLISMSDNVVPPVPGLVMGGPNKDALYLPKTDPELSYEDITNASINENCISNNASVVYIFNAMEYYRELEKKRR